MENKIKEILSNRADYYIDSNGKSHDIIRGHPDDIMDEIVKLFAIPAVVGQSEQLVCEHPDEAIIKDKPTDYCLACNRNI
jgi:hypothetical protein